MWIPIKDKEDIAKLALKTLIRRVPEEDDYIKQPVEYVLLINNVEDEMLELTIPLMLQDWLLTWYNEKYFIGALHKSYDRILEQGTWQWLQE